MRAEERLVEELLHEKCKELEEIHEHVRAEDDRDRRLFQQHKRDLEAFQVEADCLDKNHRAGFLNFQRDKRDLENQLAR